MRKLRAVGHLQCVGCMRYCSCAAPDDGSWLTRRRLLRYPAAGNASVLYDSVHDQIFSLPDTTTVWPAHDYRGRTCSSVAEEKAHNPRLSKGREEFVDIMANLGLPHPKHIARAVPANLRDGHGS